MTAQWYEDAAAAEAAHDAPEHDTDQPSPAELAEMAECDAIDRRTLRLEGVWLEAFKRSRWSA